MSLRVIAQTRHLRPKRTVCIIVIVVVVVFPYPRLSCKGIRVEDLPFLLFGDRELMDQVSLSRTRSLNESS